MRAIRPSVAARAVMALTLLVFSSLTYAQGAVQLPVSPGWDFFHPLVSGKVIFNSPDSTLDFQITYILVGAEAGQTYSAGFDIFNTPDPGLSYFGVSRATRGVFTREGVTATVDVFPVGIFVTDADGNGSAHFNLNLSGVPSGTYLLQFVWARMGLAAFYRTGQTYGMGFAVITVP